MLKLNLSNKPEWLDLGHGVRIRLLPLTTALMVAARNDPAVSALPEDTGDEQSALVFAKALGMAAAAVAAAPALEAMANAMAAIGKVTGPLGRASKGLFTTGLLLALIVGVAVNLRVFGRMCRRQRSAIVRANHVRRQIIRPHPRNFP